MAVDEEASWWPTENLVLKAGRKRYRTKIWPWHWQLRAQVNAEGNDTVYYLSNSDATHVTRLNTQTRETETIKVLNFHPRCMAAKDGWVCCGGEHGEFAVIRDAGQAADDTDDISSSDFRTQLAALEAPGTDGSLSQFSRDMFNLLERRLNGSGKTWTARSHKFGRERVNCITVWQPPTATSLIPSREGHYPGAVAVLANNDKTISIVGLQDCDCLDELSYPDCVNRGIISPDGSMLAAVTDDPYLYIHVRKPAGKDLMGERFEWKPLPGIRLKAPKKVEPDDCHSGSFAAAFSASGRYLAIGTQYGTIEVLDVAALRDTQADPLVAWWHTSRFPDGKGAVRDLAFCPGPYDLLAWTEHRGRVGVADGRTSFTQRQIIPLDKHDDFEHVSLNDRNTIDPRLLDNRNEHNSPSGSSPNLPSLLRQMSSPRPLPDPETSDTTERLNQPFTSEETAILDALRESRRRREAGESRDQPATRGSAAPRSIWAERVSSSSSSVSQLRSTLHQTELHANTVALQRYRVIAHELRQQRETLTRILERERNREAARDTSRTQAQNSSEQDRDRRAPTPRRRSSVVQALTRNAADNPSQAGGNRNQGSSNNESSSSRDSPTPWAAQRLTSGWADLEALYNLTNGETGGTSDSTRELGRRFRAIPVISDLWSSDDVSGLNTSSSRRYVRYLPRDHTQHDDDTAGLAWSGDGQTLYVGCEDGICEFHINLLGRKTFPEITLR